MRSITSSMVVLWGVLTIPVPACADGSEAAAPALKVVVRQFQFTGATAFSRAELETAVAPYTHRPLTSVELQSAAAAVTQLYEDRGYWNSGAVLPDQTITNGVVLVSVTEGELSQVFIQGNRRLKADWLERRIRKSAPKPLKMDELAMGLQRLQRDPNIEQLSVELQPLQVDGSTVPGGSVLDVRVQEASPWRVALQIDNQRPLNVGENELMINLADNNLTGHSDVLAINYGILQEKSGGGVEFSGDGNIGAAYTIPVTPRDLRVTGFYDRRNYAVIQPPFNELNIESSYWGAGLRLNQPVYRTGTQEINVGMIFEYRRSLGTLLGDPFDAPGTINGQVNVTALRLTGDWSRAWSNQAVAVQVVGSFGIDAFGATVLPQERDGRFFALLSHAQYRRDLWKIDGVGPGHSGELVMRGGFQWTPDNLPAMEQLTFGGLNSVRGYPQNYAVRDSGLMVSGEIRTPLLEHRRASLVFGPFVDFGAGWNVNEPTPDPPTLSSVGVLLQAVFWNQLNVQVNWGYGFNRTLFTSEEPQYHGVNFVVVWQVL